MNTAALRVALPRDCLVVLAFHRVGDDLPPWHFGVTPAHLRAVVEVFARVADPVRLADGLSGRGRRLAVTFDDGFADNVELAVPLLEALGVPATLFVPAGCLERGEPPWPDRAYARLLALPAARLTRLARRLAPGRPAREPLAAAHAAVHGLKSVRPDLRDALIAALPLPVVDAGRMASWEELAQIGARGFDVGAHGHTHAILTGLGDEELQRELVESRTLIESRLGRPCTQLAYPDGRADTRVASAARDAGYTLAVAGGDRLVLPGADALRLPRLGGEDVRLHAVVARAAIAPRRRIDFDEQAGRYDAERADEYGFATQAAIVRDELARHGAGSVLDAGCGTGSLAPALESAGAGIVTGVDASAEMVGRARARRPLHRWLRADVARLPFASHRFDAAVSLGVLEYVESPHDALRELARVTRPGGPVIVSVPQRNAPNELALRLFDRLRLGAREGSRPLTLGALRSAILGAGIELDRVRSTNFFLFPFTNVAPRASERVARALDTLGRTPLARRLGAQLVAVGRVPARPTVVWLVPSLPVTTTFLERERAALQAEGVDVDARTPRAGAGACLAFACHPVRAVRVGIELQHAKAARDRERGRLGYVVLWLRGLALAHELRGRAARLHASFADGVGTVAYVASVASGRPFSFTAHSPYSLWQGSRLLAAQASHADVVVCQNECVERALRALAPAAHTCVVRSPAPVAREPLPLRPPYRLVCVGQLIPHKGFAAAVEAVAVAAGRNVPVELEVLGDGPERARLEDLARSLGAPVAFAGAVANDVVMERLRGALALLAPCEVQPDGDRDGLPVSIVDAAACARPAIATPVCGIPEAVVEGETGLLFPERDPAALADAIERLVADPALADALGRAAQQYCVVEHDPRASARALVRAWGL